MKKFYSSAIVLVSCMIFFREGVDAQLVTNSNVPITITTGGSISVRGDIQNNTGTINKKATSAHWIVTGLFFRCACADEIDYSTF